MCVIDSHQFHPLRLEFSLSCFVQAHRNAWLLCSHYRQLTGVFFFRASASFSTLLHYYIIRLCRIPPSSSLPPACRALCISHTFLPHHLPPKHHKHTHAHIHACLHTCQCSCERSAECQIRCDGSLGPLMVLPTAVLFNYTLPAHSLCVCVCLSVQVLLCGVAVVSESCEGSWPNMNVEDTESVAE